MAAHVGLGAAPREAEARPDATPPTRSISRWSIPGPVLSGLAYGFVALPFVVAFVRLLSEPSSHLNLTDDLALIDLHTRRAIAWHQQLGVFDRNGWSHPGPSYFYVLGLVYRVFGSNGQSLFLGATLINGAAALGCVAVVRRFTTPTRALFSALVAGVLAYQLSASGIGSTTYSETVLGALVSPWNPLVVIFPLLLLLLLCAAAMARSAVAAAGAVFIGSFVVQTDVSTLPLVVVALLVGEITWLVRLLRGRRTAADGDEHRSTAAGKWLVVGVLLALTILMWVPPLVEQFTNHPGNMTLIYRFFTSGRGGHPIAMALGATAASAAVLVVGPSEVMRKGLEGLQPNQVLAGVTLGITAILGLVAALIGRRNRSPFGGGLGVLSIAGVVAVAIGVTHLVGHIYGYLVMWAVVLPAAALLAAGTVRLPDRWSRGLLRTVGPTALRGALVVLVAVASVATLTRVLSMPPLSRASDPEVAQLVSLVTPHLERGEAVSVNDAHAGRTKNGVLIDIERFFGLVNELDRQGYDPKVNPFWVVELGPSFADHGHTAHSIVLVNWTPKAETRPGYLGRVGDMAVFLAKANASFGLGGALP